MLALGKEATVLWLDVQGNFRRVTPFRSLRTYNANLPADAAWQAGAPPRLAHINSIPQAW